MDEAWSLEQQFWSDLKAGRAGAFYMRHMAADGFVVLPSGALGRDELIVRWDHHEPVDSYTLGDPKLQLVEGANLLMTYHVAMDAPWLHDYSAWMTALYVWEAGGWVLMTRAHTPSGAFSF